MGIREAIAEFNIAKELGGERFNVYALGVHIGSATHMAQSSDETECWTYYYNYYPRSPTGIIPYGDIVINWDDGEVYLFNGKEGDDTVVNTDHAVSLIEAITKEL